MYTRLSVMMFLEFFIWMPYPVDDPQTWSLMWFVYEVLGLDIRDVPVDHRLAVTGGGARSAAYRQLLADLTGRQVHLVDEPETAAAGAAIQAAAVTALGKFNTEEVTQALLDRWPVLAGKAREAALTAMLARPERTVALLKKVQGSSRAFPPNGKAPEAPSTFPVPSDFSAMLNEAPAATATIGNPHSGQRAPMRNPRRL